MSKSPRAEAEKPKSVLCSRTALLRRKPERSRVKIAADDYRHRDTLSFVTEKGQVSKGREIKSRGASKSNLI